MTVEAPQQYDNCTAVAKGVFTGGVRSALELYLRIARGLNDQLVRLPLTTLSDVDEALHSEAVLVMQTMAESWLSQGLEKSARLYQSELTDYNENFQEIRQGLAIMFFIAIVALLLVVYDPLVRALDDDFKKVRSILIMVPLSWLEENRELADLLKAQATN